MVKKESTRLDKALVLRGLVKSRARAKTLIEEGGVAVDGMVVIDPDFSVSPHSALTLLHEDIPWVSRGALKLLHAFDEWDFDVEGKVVLDIGASTGGFTEVLLSKGAAEVYALDVGHDQLAPSLLKDPRVVSMEGKHILDATSEDFAEPIEFIVIDVSFISLTKILAKAYELLAEGGELIALVKPQFEVGKEHIDKGIVRDPYLREEAVRRAVLSAKDAGWVILGTADSPIEGGDGNKEYLLYAVKSHEE